MPAPMPIVLESEKSGGLHVTGKAVEKSPGVMPASIWENSREDRISPYSMAKSSVTGSAFEIAIAGITVGALKEDEVAVVDVGADPELGCESPRYCDGEVGRGKRTSKSPPCAMIEDSFPVRGCPSSIVTNGEGEERLREFVSY